MTTFQGTNTYLIECSRENSEINQEDNEDTNGAWSNQVNFNVKRGDRISVEMVCANIRGSGTGAPTIEFSGQNVVVNGKTKAYCDTKVLIEVFFTLNNNNVYSCGLPLIHPRGGINGIGTDGSNNNYNNLVMPFNLNPRLPVGQVTNQINNYREINYGYGYVSQYPYYGAIKPYIGITGALPAAQNNVFNSSYGIYQYALAGAWQVAGAGITQAAAGRITGMRIIPHAMYPGATTPSSVQPAPFDGLLPFLSTDFENGVLKGRTQPRFQNNFYVGNHVFVSDMGATLGPAFSTNKAGWCGKISEVNGVTITSVPTVDIKFLEILFDPDNAAGVIVGGRPFDFPASQTSNGDNPGMSATARCAVYVGELFVDGGGEALPTWNVKNGSSQEGLINYDNLDLNNIPLDNRTTTASSTSFSGNGFMRGNNAHFMYARNTRKPQLNQNPDLALFPNTTYNPIVTSGGATPYYTTTAGEYGKLPVDAEVGYRNANIQCENNNQPYIFMRNDHFGSGRLGMNGEKMPKAMPMTAFIYITIEELLQDVNSLTQVINDKLRKTISGIGTTIPNTGNNLNSNIENPNGRQPASSITPYYNRIGFYDPDVTEVVTSTVVAAVPAYTETIPQPSVYTPPVPEIPEVPGSTTIYNSTADGTVALVSDFDVANNVSPMVLGNGAKLFTDDGGLNSDYSTSHSRHATFDAGAGNCIYINPRDFEFEHSTYSMYDRLGITCSNTVGGLSTSAGNLSSADSTLSQYLYQSSNASPSSFWGTSWTSGNGGYGTGGGWMFPNSAGTDVKGNDNSGWINNWYKIDARYVRFWFISDGSATEPGWDILIARAVVVPTIPAVPAVPGFYTPVPDVIINPPAVPASSLSVTQADLMNVSRNAQYRNLMTDVIPIKNGGTVKICPANGTAGRDYLTACFGKQNGGFPTYRGLSTVTPIQPGFYPNQFQLNNLKTQTYLRQIETSETPNASDAFFSEVNYQGWANPFYGNMATADLYKYMLGDRYHALPINPMNLLGNEPDPTAAPGNIGTLRGIGKAVICNCKLQYRTLTFKCPRGFNNYLGALSNFPPGLSAKTPAPLNTTILYENQIIYTNVPFPTQDDADGSWTAYAKAIRKYELYENKTERAPQTFKGQQVDLTKWVIDGDVGQTDDRTTSQLRTMIGQPRYMPPNVSPETGAITDPQNIYQQNRPMYYDWLKKPDPAASSVADPVFGTSLGWDASNNFSPGRSLLCPTTTHEIFAGVSATGNIDEDEKYKMLKELGRIKLKSRFNPAYMNTAKNFVGIVIGTLTFPSLADYQDIGFIDAETVDTTFVKNLDIGMYPYKQYFWEDDGGGTIVKVERVLCAMLVGIDYNTNFTETTGTIPEYETAANLSNINLGALCWGNQIGISQSFFDNHAIIPMNNDQVKRVAPLSGTTFIEGKWIEIGYQDNTNQLAGAAPPAPNTPSFTGTAPPGKPTQYDFTTLYNTPIYLQPNGKVKYRITYFGFGVGSGPEQIQGIWEQSSELNSAAVTGYNFLSGDSDWFNNPGHPGNKPFLGLQRTTTQNTTDNPWLLTTPAPNNNIGVGNPGTASQPAPGWNAWSCFSCTSGGPVINPTNPAATLPYYAFQPAGLNIGFDYVPAPAPQVTIEVFQIGVTVSNGSTVPVNLGLEPNKVNYIWTGATQPTFRYDPDRGRVQFIQLQDDNILNEKSIPYSKTVASSAAAGSTGQTAGIINSASQDAVYSRNGIEEDFSSPSQTTPIRNQGIRAEIGGVGIFNVFLCPENYEPPTTVNLSSYWSNDVAPDGNYWNNTEVNRQKIIEGCIEADENNWAGSLFARLGFQSYRELMPVYGKQNNRFNPDTYNTNEPSKISRATKPLILCNAIDNSIMPGLNTYYTLDPCGNSINGVPLYSNGFLNNSSVALDVTAQALTASAPPILSTSPFLLIESNICQTNWQSGATHQNILFYLMKNYSAASFIYGYGSSYTHTANQDTVLSLINTAFRDPITGRLQKCSPNSTVIYKVQRDVVIPPPQTTIEGVPLDNTPPESSTDKLLQELVDQGSADGGAGGAGGGAIGVGSNQGSRVGDGGAPPGAGAAAIQQQMIDDILTTAGATNNIIQGTLAAENMANTFAAIDTMNLQPQAQEELISISYIVNRLLAGFQVELQMLEGKVVPDYLAAQDRGRIGNSTGALANMITSTLWAQFGQLGGLTGIQDMIASGNFQPLLNAGGIMASNPNTGAPLISQFGNPGGEYSLLSLNDGGQTLISMSELFLDALTIQQGGIQGGTRQEVQDREDEIDQLLTMNTRLLGSSIEDERVVLNGPLGQYEPVPAIQGRLIDIGAVRTAALSALSEPREPPPPPPRGESKESKGGESKRMSTSSGFQGEPRSGTPIDRRRTAIANERQTTPVRTPRAPGAVPYTNTLPPSQRSIFPLRTTSTETKTNAASVMSTKTNDY